MTRKIIVGMVPLKTILVHLRCDRFESWSSASDKTTFKEVWVGCPAFMWLDDVVHALSLREKGIKPITELRAEASRLRKRDFTADGYSREAHKLYRADSAVSLIKAGLISVASTLPQAKKNLGKVMRALDDEPISKEEANEAVRVSGIDVVKMASSIRSKISDRDKT
jgi:hypothetical protein